MDWWRHDLMHLWRYSNWEFVLAIRFCAQLWCSFWCGSDYCYGAVVITLATVFLVFSGVLLCSFSVQLAFGLLCILPSCPVGIASAEQARVKLLPLFHSVWFMILVRCYCNYLCEFKFEKLYLVLVHNA
jgi:hypothetical protein